MRTSDWSLCICVLAATAAAPVWLAAEGVPASALGRVALSLTATPILSESARASMIDEAVAIWSRHGIILDWLPGAGDGPASQRLRVVIVERPLDVNPGVEPVAIGELIRPLSGDPVALISIAAAKHLVSSVPGRVGEDLAAVDERRLGKVLGRTLAHEIGHYLLNTHTHARNGLMRPDFDAIEFSDLRDGAFALDHVAATWLRTRNAEKFAYAR